MNEEELLKMMKDLKSSLDFYKPRCEQLQQQQSKMRDPERTMVCDILANGKLLYPDLAGDRYSLNPEKCPETCIYKRFSANMRNAAEHDAITAKKERLRYLTELVEYAHKNQYLHFPMWELDEMLEALRSQQ